MGVRLGRLGVGLVSALVALTSTSLSTSTPAAASPRVLLVCNNTTFACPTGAAKAGYTSIQAAVDAAHQGDWILVWPGDYREHGNTTVDHSAGVWITTPDIFLRGMDSRLVVVDGTKSGPECSTAAGDQGYGPADPSNGNQPAGRDGVVVWKADGTWLENFTACNFLTSASGHHGNEIWWNGGDGSGQIGLHSYWGDYLGATSTYSSGPKGNDNPRGEYGIFSSNTGNGTCGEQGTESTPTGNCYTGFMNHAYANNMGDAAFYIGACPDCSQVLENSHGQNSALGFSGTNAGGDFIIRTTEFDNNKTGLTSNSQNNDDQPSPQSGLCPSGKSPPVAGAVGCTIFEDNYIHDNNNPNVPGVGQGLSGGAPISTGVVLGGTRFTTLYRNVVSRNGAWGVLVTDEPDFGETPPSYATYCRGGSLANQQAGTCWYQAWGNATIANEFVANGGLHNPTNGDVALIEPLTGALPPPYNTLPAPPDDPNKPGNCFHDNFNPAYGYDPSNHVPVLKSDPPPFPASEAPSSYLQNPNNPYTPPNGNDYATCGQKNNGNNDPVLVGEAACNTQLLFPCPYNPVAAYPQQTRVKLMSLAQTQAATPTMPNPCGPDSWGEVPPPNPWCPYTGPKWPPPPPGGGSSGGGTQSTGSGSGGVSATSATPGLPTTGQRPPVATATRVELPLLVMPLAIAMLTLVARRRRRLALSRSRCPPG